MSVQSRSTTALSSESYQPLYYCDVSLCVQLPPATLSSVQTLRDLISNASSQLIDSTQLLISVALLESNLESIAANPNVSQLPHTEPMLHFLSSIQH